MEPWAWELVALQMAAVQQEPPVMAQPKLPELMARPVSPAELSQQAQRPRAA
jgi:hypothetical protein